MAVAVTGATGFLGVRLVDLLLRQGQQIFILAHARSSSALDRIIHYLKTSGAPGDRLDAIREQITVADVDVTLPRLGLPRHRFQHLANTVDVIWHTAATTVLNGNAIEVSRVNVEGTRNVLELAAAGVREPMVHHVSTAFVAGRRHHGTVYESDLDNSYGFENPYEESKYHAERLVHDWSRRSGRPATIFRPSILVTDRPVPPGCPDHPLLAMVNLANVSAPAVEGVSAYAPLQGVPRFPVRILGHPQAYLNLMPVQRAAKIMVSVAAHPAFGRVRTYHITHPTDVPVRTLLDVFEDLYPVQAEIVTTPPQPPSPWESYVFSMMTGFLPYAYHRRHYDRTGVCQAGLHSPDDDVPLDADYLLRGLRADPDRLPRSLERRT